MPNQRLLEMAVKIDREETVSAIRAGLADVEAKRTKPARTTLNRLAKKYGIRGPEPSPGTQKSTRRGSQGMRKST